MCVCVCVCVCVCYVFDGVSLVVSRYVNFLKVRARHYDGHESVQWSRSGEQGEMWIQATVSLSAIEGPFQLIVEATRGYNQLSDIAIDDILIMQSHCNLEPGK